MEVEKTLQPGAPGARKSAERFGDRLICVRRRDDIGGRRITTVEVVVDERPFLPTSLHCASNPPPKRLVRIAYDESALRQQVKDAVGRWLPELKLWELSQQQVEQPGLQTKVVHPPSPRSGHTEATLPRNRRFYPDMGICLIHG